MIIAFDVIREDKFLISLISCAFKVTCITCERHKRCSWRRMPVFIACHMSLRCTISHINLRNCFEMTYCEQNIANMCCFISSTWQSVSDTSIIDFYGFATNVFFFTFITYRESMNINLRSWILDVAFRFF